jgi:carbon-monoxide dehydrogenase medium subunit
MANDAYATLPEFEYVRPVTLVEASNLLAQYPDEARPFLGGTDIINRIRDGLLAPKYLVDIKNLEGIKDLHYDPKIGLTIGAAVNMNRVIVSPDVQSFYPLLAEACRSVASYQLRTRATVVGNICNASPAGDTIGACLVYGAVLFIHGVKGQRQEPLDSFFLAPGKTTLQPGDIVMAVHLPIPPANCEGVYLKLGRNNLSDLSIVGVTVLGYPDSKTASGYRIRMALASVAPVPFIPQQVEDYLAENPITPKAIQEAAQLAADSCSPIDDVRGSKKYRRHMVKNLSEKALSQIWKKLNQ